MQAAVQVAHQQNQLYAETNVWSTRITQCGYPGEDADWFFSFLCFPCAAASAKSRADRSNVVYDLLCWNPIASYSYLRHEYGINGSCGDDCGYGFFCGCCQIRQAYTESRLRGISPKPWSSLYGQNLDHWQRSLFDCTFCGFLKACVCPCCAAADVREILQPSAAGDDCFNAFCLNPAAMYGQVRNHYGILADCPLGEDIFTPLFCFPCSLNRARVEAMHRREMMARMLAQQQQQMPGNQNPTLLQMVFRRN